MRVTIHCEVCGGRNRLERRVLKPEQLRLTCIHCEAQLVAEVTWEGLLMRQPLPVHA